MPHQSVLSGPEFLQGLDSDIAFNSDHMPEAFIESFEALVKDTIEDELADAIIRILDIAGSMTFCEDLSF